MTYRYMLWTFAAVSLSDAIFVAVGVDIIKYFVYVCITKQTNHIINKQYAINKEQTNNTEIH